jgi:hypothetical protein
MLYNTGFSTQRPRFGVRVIHTGFMVDVEALRQKFSEHFTFPARCHSTNALTPLFSRTGVLSPFETTVSRCVTQ